MSRAGWLVLLACASSSGCWLALDLEGNEYTRAGGASAGGGGGAPTSGGGGSAEIHVGMVFVEHGDDDFYIDATEVTNAAYAAWLAEGPALDAITDSRCAWNSSFRPGVLDTCGGEVDTLCETMADTFDEVALTAADRPVACIDWCDAFAYCQLNGKHLCGGPGGARIEFNPDFPGALHSPISEWFFACSGEGEQAYPYGDALVPARCNDDANGLGTLVDVGTMSGCEGSFPGVVDLSGNAEEWVNACYLGDEPEVSCARPGGAYYDEDPSCTAVRLFERSCQTNGTGFRCCAD